MFAARLFRPAAISARSFSAAAPRHTAAPPSLSEGEQYIHDKLAKELSPSELQVQDVSGPASFTLHIHVDLN